MKILRRKRLKRKQRKKKESPNQTGSSCYILILFSYLLFSAESSRSATPTDHKRKLVNDALAGPSNKKQKLDSLVNYIPGSR